MISTPDNDRDVLAWDQNYGWVVCCFLEDYGWVHGWERVLKASEVGFTKFNPTKWVELPVECYFD